MGLSMNMWAPNIPVVLDSYGTFCFCCLVIISESYIIVVDYIPMMNQNIDGHNIAAYFRMLFNVYVIMLLLLHTYMYIYNYINIPVLVVYHHHKHVIIRIIIIVFFFLIYTDNIPIIYHDRAIIQHLPDVWHFWPFMACTSLMPGLPPWAAAALWGWSGWRV